jgi:hypothetical protein
MMATRDWKAAARFLEKARPKDWGRPPEGEILARLLRRVARLEAQLATPRTGVKTKHRPPREKK